MRHRARRIERLQAMQGKFLPAAVFLAAPVEGRGQLAGRHLVPAVGQPQGRVAIAAGLDECQVFAVRHQARGQFEGRDIAAVARQFVVEGKAAAIVADLDQAAVELEEGQRQRRRIRRHRIAIVGGCDRVVRQQVLDVGEYQFLVLLFVLQAERDQCGQRRVESTARLRLEQASHARIDVGTVGAHFVERRARQQAALGTRMLRADAVVIRVEQDPEGAVEGREVRLALLQDKGFEEPGGVRQVPFDGTGVGHRLGAAVFARQRRGQLQGTLAHGLEVVTQHGVRQEVACA
jgi:hypothetical protein